MKTNWTIGIRKSRRNLEFSRVGHLPAVQRALIFEERSSCKMQIRNDAWRSSVDGRRNREYRLKSDYINENNLNESFICRNSPLFSRKQQTEFDSLFFLAATRAIFVFYWVDLPLVQCALVKGSNRLINLLLTGIFSCHKWNRPHQSNQPLNERMQS